MMRNNNSEIYQRQNYQITKLLQTEIKRQTQLRPIHQSAVRFIVYKFKDITGAIRVCESKVGSIKCSFHCFSSHIT